MKFAILNIKDFWTGVIFVGLGGAFAVIARDYAYGSAVDMGPGYFPTLLALLLILVGIVAIIRSALVHGERTERFSVRGNLFVLGGMLVFGLVLKELGLVLATPLLIIVSALASKKARLLPTVGLAAGVTIFSVLTFVYALGLPIPIFGAWFTG